MYLDFLYVLSKKKKNEFCFKTKCILTILYEFIYAYFNSSYLNCIVLVICAKINIHIMCVICASSITTIFPNPISNKGINILQYICIHSILKTIFNEFISKNGNLTVSQKSDRKATCNGHGNAKID